MKNNPKKKEQRRGAVGGPLGFKKKKLVDRIDQN
jgi:hypothetical protein